MDWEQQKEIKKETDLYDNIQLVSPLDIKIEYDLICTSNSSINSYEVQIKKEFVDSVYQKLSYKCEFCWKNFRNSQELYEHNLVHLEVYLPYLYECDVCHSHYNKKYLLTNHIKNCHQAQLFPCEICKKGFNKYKSWHWHKTVVHSEKRFKCNDCGRLFKCKKYLKRHISCIHNKINKGTTSIPLSKGTTYNCLKCTKLFFQKQSLALHVKNVHGNFVTCEICGSTLKSNYLRVHKKRLHFDDGNDFPCDLCEKRFKSPIYLKVHKKNSHDLNAFKHDCYICHSKYKTKGGLNKHFNLVHLLGKFCKCNKCEQEFKSKERLQHHIERCHGKVTYVDGMGTTDNNSDKFDIKIKVEVMD